MKYKVKNKYLLIGLLSLLLNITNLNASTINISGIIDSTIAANIESELAVEDVTVLSDGNISIDTDITWSSQSILRLQTDNNKSIYVNATLENTNSTTGGVLFKASNIVVFDSNGLVKINNINQVNWISTANTAGGVTSTDVSGNYELASDINASDTHNWNSGKGFIPIKRFYGNFDGKNHTIDDLYINDVMLGEGGLFSATFYATIQNLGITNVDIRGRIVIGALAGTTVETNITNVYSTGSVVAERYVGSGYAGASQVGGLIGLFALNSTLSYSYSTASVTAIGLTIFGTEKIGGLVGEEYATTSIEHCYSNNIVTAIDHDGNLLGQYIGGLLGYSAGGLLNDNYTLGSVSGQSKVGGLVGVAYDSTITNNYSMAKVTGDGNYTNGSLIGERVVGAYSSKVYSNFAYGKVTGLSGGFFGATSTYSEDTLNGFDIDVVSLSKSTASLLSVFPFYSSNPASANFSIFDAATIGAYWDLTTVWFSIQDYTRPILRSRHSLIIKDAQQLQLMAMDLTADYVLGADIDLSDSKSNNSNMWNTLYGFVPIGDASTPFTGSFDGAGYTISNLFTDRNSSDNIGLFGYTQDANISNVVLLNVDVTGNSVVGALVGTSVGGSISKSYATGMVNAKNTVIGGLVGEIVSGAISDSYTSVTVSGTDKTGGLIGSVSGADISYCYAIGLVNATSGSLAGGLVGDDNSSSTTALGSFWDVNTTGQATTASGATGLSTSQMQKLNTFISVGWDISGLDGNYPTLNSNNTSTWVITSQSKLLPIIDASKIVGYENISGAVFSSIRLDSFFTIDINSSTNFVELSTELTENIPTGCNTYQAYSTLSDTGSVYTSFKAGGCVLADDATFVEESISGLAISVQIMQTTTEERNSYDNTSSVIISDLILPLNKIITIGDK